MPSEALAPTPPSVTLCGGGMCHVEIGACRLIAPLSVCAGMQHGTPLAVSWEIDAADDPCGEGGADAGRVELHGRVYRSDASQSVVSCGGLVVTLPHADICVGTPVRIWFEASAPRRRRAAAAAASPAASLAASRPRRRTR